VISAGQRFLGGSVCREKFPQPGNLDDGAALMGESRKRKRLSLVSPMHKQLHQRTHARGVEKRYPAHFQDEVGRAFRPDGLDEIGNGLNTQRALQPQNQPVAIGPG